MKFTNLPIILYHINEIRNKKYLLLKNNTNIFNITILSSFKRKDKILQKKQSFYKNKIIDNVNVLIKLG